MAFPAIAGSFIIPADVSVALTAEPNAGLTTGQSITFTISATNHGPAPVEFLAISSSQFTDEFYLSGESTDCQVLGLVVVDLEFSFFYYFNWLPTLDRTLEVGETRSCHLILPLSSSAPATFTFGFGIPDFFIDNDPSNNIASVTLRRAVEPATPIPALSTFGLIVLAALLALVAGISRRMRT